MADVRTMMQQHHADMLAHQQRMAQPNPDEMAAAIDKGVTPLKARGAFC